MNAAKKYYTKTGVRLMVIDGGRQDIEMLYTENKMNSIVQSLKDVDWTVMFMLSGLCFVTGLMFYTSMWGK